MIATAFIVLGSNMSVAMHSVETDEVIGDLTYSCNWISNSKYPEFSGAGGHQGIESDLRNNNVEFKGDPPPVIAKPMPKPRTPYQPSDVSDDDGYRFGNESPANKSSRPAS